MESQKELEQTLALFFEVADSNDSARIGTLAILNARSGTTGEMERWNE